ncbi:MAG: hypothetical protein KOO60_13560 [Gemmatimonadales bacterium]|nr:hypothetical protein [Gemmatimonadales bacterium]
MEQRLSTPPEPAARESEILNRLLALYEEERQVYSRVQELTQNQLDQVRQGAPLADVRRILTKKKACLEVIGRLEMTEGHTKNTWAQGRHRWSGSSKARLHEALQVVTGLIEDILATEEKCDMYLIEQARGV